MLTEAENAEIAGSLGEQGYLQQDYLTVKSALADTDFQTHIFK